MARTFFPEIYEQVQASPPHPEGAFYRVSIGLEQWEADEYVPVIKVQMVYDGKVFGRKAPSYPMGTDDYARVNKTIEDLVQRRYQNAVAERQALYNSDT